MNLHEEKKEIKNYEKGNKKGFLKEQRGIFSELRYIRNETIITNSIISDGCVIYGTVENSIIYDNVYIGKNCIIKNSIIMPNVKVRDNTIVENVILDGDIVAEGMYVAENKQAIIEYDNNYVEESMLVACR